MRRSGFTLIEIVMVLGVVSVTMGIAVFSLRDFGNRTASRRAADVFVRDLQLARTTALRERTTISIVFDEANDSYAIRSPAGRVVARRSFGPGTEIPVGSLDLELTGDSVPFDARGMATLAGAVGSLGTAVFVAGTSSHTVSFTALGAAEIGYEEVVDAGGGGGWK